jgi:(p)ppGpp synthase/HD superfamily hydrolase
MMRQQQALPSAEWLRLVKNSRANEPVKSKLAQ